MDEEAVLEIMATLGLADRLHELRHTKAYGPTIETADGPFRPIDFRRLKTEFPYIMLVPELDFLNFIVDQARKYPSFELRMGALVHDLIKEHGVVKGICFRDDVCFPSSRAVAPAGTKTAYC